MGIKQIKNWFIARGIVRLVERDELDEKIIAMIEVLDKRLSDEFGSKDSEAVQDSIVKKLLVICQKLKEENPERLKALIKEIVGAIP